MPLLAPPRAAKLFYSVSLLLASAIFLPLSELIVAFI